jgi:hypothetical protein
MINKVALWAPLNLALVVAAQRPGLLFAKHQNRRRPHFSVAACAPGPLAWTVRVPSDRRCPGAWRFAVRVTPLLSAEGEERGVQPVSSARMGSMLWSAVHRR